MKELLRVLFIGDDWAEDHHDVEVLDAAATRFVRRDLATGRTTVLAGGTRNPGFVVTSAQLVSRQG